MSTTQKMGKKKLVVSLILFIVAFIFFGSAIGCLVSMLLSGEAKATDYYTTLVPLALGYFIFLILSIVLNFSYRRRNAKPGALSTVLFIVSLVMFIGLLGVALYFLAALAGGNTPETVTVKDENGNELTLTASSEASNEYKDQYGQLWKTTDGGRTFERKTTIAKDEDGKEFTLTPSFEGSHSYFKDQNGDDWTTYDGGQTFERD